MDSGFTSKIFFRRGCLTIGAPSSPTLSNVLMYDFDDSWHKRCVISGISYSRYADDITFSTNKPDILESICEELSSFGARPFGLNLSLNQKKTVYSSKKHLRLTGLVLTSDSKISLGREKAVDHNTMLSRIERYTIGARIAEFKGIVVFCLFCGAGIYGASLHKIWPQRALSYLGLKGILRSNKSDEATVGQPHCVRTLPFAASPRKRRRSGWMRPRPATATDRGS